jgi:hypothetical protein
MWISNTQIVKTRPVPIPSPSLASCSAHGKRSLDFFPDCQDSHRLATCQDSILQGSQERKITIKKF